MPVPNRLDDVFRQARPALICYLALGDPQAAYADPEIFIDEGVDVLEVGVPSLNPDLDGPVIADSMRRAVANGVTNDCAAEMITSFREARGRPAVVWLSYAANAQEPGFAAAVEASGADGLLVLGAASACLHPPPATHAIQFLPHRPTSVEIVQATAATGYLMVAANEGVSGARCGIAPTSASLLARARDAGVRAPAVFGFGIADGAHARRAIDYGADGVVVGTAVLTAAMESRKAVRRLLRELRQALDD